MKVTTTTIQTTAGGIMFDGIIERITEFLVASNAAATTYDAIARRLDNKVSMDEYLEVCRQLTQAHLLIQEARAEILKAQIKSLQEKNRRSFLYGYTLVRVGNGYAYRMKPVTETTDGIAEQSHFICQVCADSPDQPRRTVLNGSVGDSLYCPVCDRLFAS